MMFIWKMEMRTPANGSASYCSSRFLQTWNGSHHQRPHPPDVTLRVELPHVGVGQGLAGSEPLFREQAEEAADEVHGLQIAV